MDDRLLYRQEFYIGGEWSKPAGSETLGVISPSSEEVIGEVPIATDDDIDRAVESARSALDHGPWTSMSPESRAEVLQKAAELLRRRSPEIAEVTTEEMGCAMSQSPQAQTGMLGPVFDYYADLIRSFPFERRVVDGARGGLVTMEPAGVVAAIVPWNAPVTIAAWKVAPALAAGCTVVLKPPPEAPLSNSSWPRRWRRRVFPRGPERGARRPGGGRASCHPPRDRQDRLYRLDGSREAHHERLLGADEAGVPGARRQVGGTGPG